MKVVIAIDSFKGSMSSMEAGEAAAQGVRRAFPDAQTVVRSLADGGEGTVGALVTGMGGTVCEVLVTGPLGEAITCRYGMLKRKATAIIEMSGASGITLIPKEEQNPLYTTTYGVGQVIRDAILRGCRKFIIGIGGSATNDGGIGMLQALGYTCTDAKGMPVPFGARGVEKLADITDESVMPELADCRFHIACDVNNPLCGARGCSAVYGPQKGATEDMVTDMDLWLDRYATLARSKQPKADPLHPGAGAAGGLGFAFLTFTNAVLEPGIEIVLRETRLEDDIEDADIVLTGEGRLDGQTAMGKAPIGVARLAKKHGKPVLAFAGSVTEDAKECNNQGIDAFFPILRGVVTLEEAMRTEQAKKNMADAVEQAIRLWNL